jgi:putative tryptophan/tyrosine transport system substrate-binding protein
MKQTIFRNSVIKLAHCLLLACLYLYSSSVLAWSSVTILTTNDTQAVSDFTKELKLELNKSVPNIKIHHAKNESGLSINIPKDTLVVAVGTQALSYASNLDESTPVIGVIVPKSSYESILKESRRHKDRFTAIYLDQPFSRQFSLIKHIFPRLDSIATLLGPASQFQSNDLQKAASEVDINLTIRLVNKSDELQKNLELLLQQKQVLLAIPDPVIYSRETTQTILLTTYRHETPVIGFSQSYVKSGAIAAVFSSPKQYAIEISKLIKNLPKEDIALPDAKSSDLFSIEINRQVARSLGIKIAEDEVIYKQVVKDEE